MPNVTVTPRQMGNGDVVSQFIDSVGTTPVTYTYPKTQEKFIMRNMGPSSLSVTIAGVTQVIPRGEKWQKVADFTSFSINAVSGFVAFDAWADEKGSTFDSAEGQYFAGGVVSGGGSGVQVYATVSDLQTALPGGSTAPAWVTADKSWYYWTGADTVTIPATPTTPTATAGNTQVVLTWGAVSGATGYKVYRGGTLISSPTTNSYTDTSLTNGTVYSYTISATNTGGESAQSPATSATPTLPAIPAVPTGLTATAGNVQVALTWNAMSGATSYRVYRGGTLLASPTAANYTDTTAVNGTAYSYTISSVNAGGESAQSAAASATPTAAVTIPATPAAPTATAGNNKVDLTWTSVSGATSYKVYRGGTLLASPTTNNHSDTTAVNGTTYSYTVSAVNSAGESTQSSATSATPSTPAVVLASDSFNRADSSTTLGTSDSYAGGTAKPYTAFGTGMGIASNEAYMLGTTNPSGAVMDVSSADVAVSVTLGSHLTSGWACALRVNTTGNGSGILFHVGNNKLYTFSGASYVVIANADATTFATGDIIKVVAKGTAFTVYKNGVQILSTTSTVNQTITSHGLGNFGGGSVNNGTWDNLIIEAS